MRMTNEEIKFLEQELAACKIYLEYGAGGSTKLAAETNNIDSMISVESDPAFIKEQVLTDVSVQQAIGSLRLRFLTVDIGSTVEWGYPLTSDKSYLWPNYTLCPYMHGSEVPDLILIDGRFRIACALAAALEAPNASILIHDYCDREKYQVIEKFFKIQRSVDTLFKFSLLPDCDMNMVRKHLRYYLYSPGDDSQTIYARSRRALGAMKRRITG